MSLNSVDGEHDDGTSPTENSVLLPQAQPLGSTSSGLVGRFGSEILLLLRSSGAVILAYGLQNSLQTASVLIVGRLSPEALATSAFSYMFAMSTADRKAHV